MSKLGRLVRTVLHLKPEQVTHQLKYRLLPLPISKVPEPPAGFLPREVGFDHRRTYGANPWSDQVFHALNRTHDFSNGMDWAYLGHGKLWQYNLQYFAHLPGLDHSKVATELARVADFHRAVQDERVPLEPYPVSLRLIHLLRFRNRHDIRNAELDRWIWRQGWYLRHRLEYHLLANHLLENAFALTLTGWACNEQEWFETGLRLLDTQLAEQVLSDGAHYERSVMYHHILLFRALEFLDWAGRVPVLRDRQEYRRIRDTATLMLGWMHTLRTPDGTLARWGDVAEGVAPSADHLQAYARSMDIEVPEGAHLGASGYRLFRSGPVWCCLNAGAVAPAYQPGHAHADQLSFLLFAHGSEYITDVGISTYEADSLRQQERGTASHNTILVAGQDSAEVWGGFRVGRRPNVEILKETGQEIEVCHDGYKHIGCDRVTRWMEVDPMRVRFRDSISRNRSDWEVRLHIHPDRSVELVDGCAVLDGLVVVDPGTHPLVLESYAWCAGYNHTRSATRIRILPKEPAMDWEIRIR